MNRQLSKKYLVLGLLPVVFVAGFFFSHFRMITDSDRQVQDNNLMAKFALLSSARTNLCATAAFLDYKTDNERLQGSCCSAMDYHTYAGQVEDLKQYVNIDAIPSDPYDIQVSLAKKLLAYDKTIVLTAQQQSVHDQAMKMSDEGGPCCCKCWRWYAFDGQAKYLITQYNFDAKQIAHVWDLEDGCGGKGHEGHFEPTSLTGKASKT